MKKIYEHPTMEAIEILFHSPLMVSDKGQPDKPDVPGPHAPQKLF